MEEEDGPEEVGGEEAQVFEVVEVDEEDGESGVQSGAEVE